MLYKLMPLYYEYLSWLHLHCNGSCLLCGILVWYKCSRRTCDLQ